VNEKIDCHERAKMAAQIKGMHITSIKWRCFVRQNRFSIGDPVWARTMVGDGDEEAVWGDFPGIVVRLDGSKALVFIDKGAMDDEEEYQFQPRNSSNGFCKLPLSRLRKRAAPREEVCTYCDLPAHAGHMAGYSCSPTWSDGTPK
jgi:hypothetical protein